MKTALLCWPPVLLALALAPAAAAQEPSPSPGPATSPGSGEIRVERPPAMPTPAPRTVTVPAPPSSRAGDTADAGRWKGARAVAVRAGEAELQLADGARLRLRPGDVLGPDTVQRIEPGRILASRRAEGPDAAAATVVVSFDEAGASRVRVYALSDPRSAPPPIVK